MRVNESLPFVAVFVVAPYTQTGCIKMRLQQIPYGADLLLGDYCINVFVAE